MLHLPLPEAKQLPGPDALKRRCVQLSGGEIRLVMLEGWGAAVAVIRQWTLVCGQAGEHAWEPGFELPLAELHAHATYTFLNRVPDIEAIHPYDPNVVFFREDSHLFETSLISGETRLCQRAMMHDEVLEVSVLTLNCRPWTLIPSPMRFTEQLSLGRDRFMLRTYGTTPRITAVDIYMVQRRGFKINYSYVAAVHPSGTFQICVGYHRESRKKAQRRINAYFLATVSQHMDRLPILSSTIDHHGNAGLSVNSSGKVCVAIFQPHPLVAGRGTVHYWTTGEGTWEKIRIQYTAEGSILSWHGNGVLSQDSRLWWSDLTSSRCVLSCDPFFARDQLEHILLPEGSQPENEDHVVSINFSSGMLRLAVLDGVETPIVKLWTLIGTTDGMRSWQYNYSLDFNNIWNSPSLIASGLPKGAMPLLLVHPNKPEVLYFLKGQTILGVSSTGHVTETGPFASPEQLVEEMRCGMVHWCDRSLKSLEHLPGRNSGYRLPYV